MRAQLLATLAGTLVLLACGGGGRGSGPEPGPEVCDNAADDDRDTKVDCADPDCAAAPACATWGCGAFTQAPAGWTVASGYRAVVIADASDGLKQPVGITFAGGDLGASLYVSDQQADAVLEVDVNTGLVTPFVQGAAWPEAPALLTGIVWDSTGAFPGRKLYVADQGGDDDQTSTVFSVDASGAAAVFAKSPGPGLDDVYCMAFSPGAGYGAGLYVSGDTDGALADWGLFSAAGTGTAFSEVAGCETAVVDREGRFGGGLIAALPLGGGYAGDGSIRRIDPDGTGATPIASGLGGIHGLALSPLAGAFGGDLLAARWDAGTLLRITPAGVVTTLASGLTLTNYDANILAVSPSGSVLIVADRSASRLVCIEPAP